MTEDPEHMHDKLGLFRQHVFDGRETGEPQSSATAERPIHVAATRCGSSLLACSYARLAAERVPKIASARLAIQRASRMQHGSIVLAASPNGNWPAHNSLHHRSGPAFSLRGALPYRRENSRTSASARRRESPSLHRSQIYGIWGSYSAATCAPKNSKLGTATLRERDRVELWPSPNSSRLSVLWQRKAA